MDQSSEILRTRENDQGINQVQAAPFFDLSVHSDVDYGPSTVVCGLWTVVGHLLRPLHLFQILNLFISQESIDIFEMFLDALVAEFENFGCQAVEEIAVV